MKFITGLLILLWHITYAAAEVEITPELDKFMELTPIPKELFENNSYIGWVGINYPGDDWMTINHKIYQHNDEVLNQRMREGNVATSFVFDPLQTSLHLPNNPDTLPKLKTYKDKNNDLLYLNDFLKEDEYFLTFKQDFTGEKQYSNTRDFFACKDYLKLDCLDVMKKDKAYIEKVIRENAQNLARLQMLIKSSDYNYQLVYNDLNASMTIRTSPSTTRLYQLLIADGIMDLLNNKTDQGLEKIVLARKFIDLIHAEKSLSATLHFVLGITYTQYLDQTMDVLLSSGFLNNYLDDPRIEWILRPYPENLGYKLNESIIAIMKQSFKSISYPYIKVYTEKFNTNLLSEEDEYLVLLYLQERSIMLPPALLNVLASLTLKKLVRDWDRVDHLLTLHTKITDRSAQEAKLVEEKSIIDTLTVDDNTNLPRLELELWYVNFFNQINMTPMDALAYLNTKYSSNEFFNDYYNFLQKLTEKSKENKQLTEEVLNEFLADTKTAAMTSLVPYTEFDQYWMRLYEQQNYHQLVYLKYLIMKDRIISSKVPDFLHSMGDLAVNTITKEPYQYNVLTKVLSTPLPKESRYLPANIKEAYFDNKSIHSFQVTIP